MKKEELSVKWTPNNTPIVYSKGRVKSVLTSMSKDSKHYKKGADVYYYDSIITLDLALSSHYSGEQHALIPYAWTLCIAGSCFIGRHIEELHEALGIIQESMGLDERHRAVVFSYNLPVVFHLIKTDKKWNNCISKGYRQVISILSQYGIEFRDFKTYIGSKNFYMNDDIVLYTYNEDINGNRLEIKELDKNTLRTPNTTLTEEEKKTVVANALYLAAAVKEEQEEYEYIANLSLTETAKLKKDIYNKCYSKDIKDKYQKLMYSCSLTPKTYKLYSMALWGGYTDTNPNRENVTVEQPVECWDIRSSYLFTMYTEKVPMGTDRIIEKPTQDKVDMILSGWYKPEGVDKAYEVVSTLTVYIEGLRLKDNRTAFLKKENIQTGGKVKDHNGYIIEADKARITCTYIDFNQIKENYKANTCIVESIMYAPAGYIPNAYVDTLLNEFVTKTEDKYSKKGQRAKKHITAAFGINAVDPVREVYGYNGNTWTVEHKDIDKALEAYNNKKGRTTHYAWGVFIASAARSNLLDFINGCKDAGSSFLTGDTDSCYLIRPEKSQKVIEEYNQAVLEMLMVASKDRNKGTLYGTYDDRLAPEDNNGVVKHLGYMALDGKYTKAKSIRSKTHLLQREDGSIKLTLAGCPNAVGIETLLNTEDPFKAFTPGLIIPANNGKHTVDYVEVEEPEDIILKDYNGVEYTYSNTAAVIVEQVEYNITDYEDTDL